MGVDGGGTRARLVGSTGSLLGQGEAGPSALGQGIEQAWRHIRQAIDNAFLAAGLATAAEADCAFGLGLAGTEVTTRRERFLASAPDYRQLVLATDAATTLAGAHAGRPGAIVAVGTGTIGLARHADGRQTSANGWGFPVGDEGSGAWLGLHAMQIAQQAFDGRSATGALARARSGVLPVAAVPNCWPGASTPASNATPNWHRWCSRPRPRTRRPPRYWPPRYWLAAALLAAALLAAAVQAAAVQAIEATVAAIDPQAALPLALCGSLGRRCEPYLGAAARARCVRPAGDAIDGALQRLQEKIRQPLAPGFP